MKRFFAILLLALVLAHVAGFYVYFIVRLRAIKVDMKAALKEYPVEKLDRLVMTADEFRAAKNNEGEVAWQGYMYDVARIEKHADTWVVFALRDEAETSLFAFINNVIRMAGEDDQTPPPALTGFFSLQMLLPSEAIMPAHGSVIELEHNTRYSLWPSDAYPARMAQPPQA